MAQVQIVKEKLAEQVESGMKRKELADFYGIPESQMKIALQQAGLKIRKFHKPAFVLVSQEQISNEEIADSPEPNDTVQEEAIEAVTGFTPATPFRN